MSLPLSETGRLFACTSVISTKKAFFRPGSVFEKHSDASTNYPNLSLLDSISEDRKTLSNHLRQSVFVNNNTKVQQRYHAQIARRLAPAPQPVAFLPIASLSRTDALPLATIPQALHVCLCIARYHHLQGIVFVLVFRTPSSLMSRVRGGVAAHDLRAQATEMTSHSHLRLTVTKIQTCGTQSTRLTPLLSPSSQNPCLSVSL